MHCLLVAPNWKLNQCLFGTWFITRIQDVAYHLKLGSPVNNLKAFSNSRNLVFFFSLGKVTSDKMRIVMLLLKIMKLIEENKMSEVLGSFFADVLPGRVNGSLSDVGDWTVIGAH